MKNKVQTNLTPIKYRHPWSLFSASLAKTFLIISSLVWATFLFSGCDHEKGTQPGDRCETVDDCQAPLVCSNVNAPEGTLGICVRPEAVPDAAPADASIADADVSDAISQTQDAETSDAESSDGDLPDGSN